MRRLSLARPAELRILTINSGSSSLKVALYETGAVERLLFSKEATRIGPTPADQSKALDSILSDLLKGIPDLNLDAVSHRVVHGGRTHSEPEAITPALIEELKGLIPIDPEHLPQAIGMIEAMTARYPHVPQIACFDTAFHRRMPRVAQMFALPRRYFDEGVLRYGFHGLSYEYILGELRSLDGALADGRVIVAHLGNGASMAAIREGKCADTSMGFTPVAGLMMGTRCGDLDPGVLAYLSGVKNMSGRDLESLINRQSGLLGVSGIGEDMRDLLSKEAADPAAADAIALYCYRAKTYIGAYAAVLGGLDILVFTGGIGEHAAPIRERICAGLEFLGIFTNTTRNQSSQPVISSDESRVKVRVMKTNEELMMARHAAGLASNETEAQRNKSNADH